MQSIRLMCFWVCFVGGAFVFPVFGLELKPQLSDERDYSEYWEQQFLLHGDVLLTSQFLIANLPLSKHHGMMVSTLKFPNKDSIIIKNGRKRSGWFYDDQARGLAIFQHEIWADGDDFLMRLHNTAAEVDVIFSPSEKGVGVMPVDNRYNLPAITLYAVPSQAIARWRAGIEIGGAGDVGNWFNLGLGSGYGLHVRQLQAPHKSMRRWQRMTSLDGAGEMVPIIHTFDLNSGHSVTIILVKEPSGGWQRYSIESDQPKELQGEAIILQVSDMMAKGTIKPVRHLESFNLKDELNTLEKMVAGPSANITRNRGIVTYDFEFSLNGKPKRVQGEALFEDILFDVSGPDTHKRRRRR